jgi:hypothetical protein
MKTKSSGTQRNEKTAPKSPHFKEIMFDALPTH